MFLTTVQDDPWWYCELLLILDCPVANSPFISELHKQLSLLFDLLRAALIFAVRSSKVGLLSEGQ